jgi:hypothetical protein
MGFMGVSNYEGRQQLSKSLTNTVEAKRKMIPITE